MLCSSEMLLLMLQVNQYVSCCVTHLRIRVPSLHLCTVGSRFNSPVSNRALWPCCHSLVVSSKVV